MYKKYFAAMILLFSLPTKADLIWSWDFKDTYLEIDAFEISYLDIVLSNDISSDESIIDAVLNL